MSNNSQRPKSKKHVFSVHLDWKKLFIPFMDYDKTTGNKRTILTVGSIVLCALFVLMALLCGFTQYPNILKMITTFFVVMATYVGLCYLTSSIRIKYSRRGRKPKTETLSFEQYFLNPDVFNNVDSYIKKTFSTTKQMRTPECYTLLRVLIDGKHLNYDAEEPIAQAFIVQYGQYLSFTTPRSVTKANFDKHLSEFLKEQLVPK